MFQKTFRRFDAKRPLLDEASWEKREPSWLRLKDRGISYHLTFFSEQSDKLVEQLFFAWWDKVLLLRERDWINSLKSAILFIFINLLSPAKLKSVHFFLQSFGEQVRNWRAKVDRCSFTYRHLHSHFIRLEATTSNRWNSFFPTDISNHILVTSDPTTKHNLQR